MMMASRQALPSPTPPDMTEFDRFLNYDQATIPSPIFSPVSSRSKSISAPTSIPNSNSLPIQPSSQPFFAPPSHRYEQFSNLSGLPVGALRETYSVNQAYQSSYGPNHSYYGNSHSGGFEVNTGNDFDLTGQNLYNTYNGVDVEIDFASAPQSHLKQSVDELDAFVDPSALAAEETVSQPPKRAYPGMHQQQAEQKQKQLEAQRQQAAAASSSRAAGPRPSGSANHPPTDPVVEQTISQLLNQMRHNSVSSSNEDDSATPVPNDHTSHGSRMKKDEEEMDEDERLLASEEGKKLSSKERRQLRNKVSARAFRSRRKGIYIYSVRA